MSSVQYTTILILVHVALSFPTRSGCAAGGEAERCRAEVAVLAASDHQQETPLRACREEEDAGGSGAQRGEINPAGTWI